MTTTPILKECHDIFPLKLFLSKLAYFLVFGSILKNNLKNI